MELSYSFGHFQLFPERRALLAGDQPLKLGGRAFDVLTALVQRSDRVLSKHELMDIAWPRLVVEENNLNVQIVMLRKLLGFPAIATVPGRGYCFALPVIQVGGPPGRSDASGGANSAPLRATDGGPGGSQAEPDARKPRTNLPPHLPPLYGRAEDLAAVGSLLCQHPIVTVTGAGGIGKTRLGQAVAAQALAGTASGVWWIELAPLNRGGLVPATVAAVLGLELSAGRDPTQAVLAHLRGQSAVLVLDNCEHVLDAVAGFAAALCASQAPGSAIRLLVTSQEVLKMTEEHIYRLGTLTLPDAGANAGAGLSPAAVAASGAGALFLARARAVESRFEITAKNVDAVVEICRRLDGIPLAIELAVARLPLLGIEGVRAKLNERFNVLTGGARAMLRRHQTLRAALDWSHSLLSPAEQAVFRRLAVFAGGFRLEAAQYVAHDDAIDEWDVLEHLGALVDKSLVLAEGDPLPRYRLLETTRLFGLERLGAAGETESTLQRHVQAMVALIAEQARAIHDRFRTPSESAQLALEVDNVRAALDWLEQGRDTAAHLDDLAIELGGLAGDVLSAASGEAEGFERTLALRSRIGAATPPQTAARFWLMLADMGAVAGHAASYEAAMRAAALYAELNDDAMRYRCLSIQIAVGARLGMGALLEPAVIEARRIKSAQAPVQRIYFCWACYRWAMSQGRCEEALAFAQEQARIAHEADMPTYGMSTTGDTVVDCELALGRVDAADAHSREALAWLESRPGTRYRLAHVVDTRVRVLIEQGKAEEAIDMARRALQLTRNEGFQFRLIEPLALNAARQGRLRDAAWLTGHIDASYAQRGEVRWPNVAAQRLELDALLAAGLAPQALGELRAEGASATVEAAFARAFGDA